MAYYFFMGAMQVPIPPETLTTKVNGRNETINLINKGEVSVIKTTGLTDVNFKVLLPNSNYPFNQSLLFKGKQASYYLDEFERLKIMKSIFQFIVVRMKPNGEMLQMTNMKVTLENYTVEEDAGNGFDCYVDIQLKQWRDYGTKVVKLQTDKDGKTTGVAEETRHRDRVPAVTAKASEGTTLQRMVKQQFGNTSNLFGIAGLNKIAVPGVLTAGQVIKMRDEGELSG